MKHSLLIGLMLATFGVANAGPERPARKTVPEITKNLLTAKTLRHQAPMRAEEQQAESTALFESFEAWPIETGDLTWLPEGWSAKRTVEAGEISSWVPFYQYNGSYPTPADGQYYFMIFYSDEERDEWLISPEFEVQGKMDLSYYLMYSPLYLFSVDNINWDTFEYEGDKIVAATLQVLIKAEGDEEWTLIEDLADRYKDYTAYELAMIEPEEMQRQVNSLAAYDGKKVQLAFRYVGRDGNSMWIDAIRVGAGALDNVSYAMPNGTFYWGYTPDYYALSTDIAQLPVYQPVTFANNSEDDATFSWSYIDPFTGEEAISDDQFELELTYKPYYNADGTLADNLFAAPILNATAPDKAASGYSPQLIIHAGGNTTREIEGKTYEYGLFPFPKNTANIGGLTVMDDKVGDPSIPVFGHNSNTNLYWYHYTANNDEDATPETCYNHLIGIANLYMPEVGSQLVVNGVNVFGYGLIRPEAELKFTIYALLQRFDEDGWSMGISTEPDDFTTVATATIKGSDIISQAGDNTSKDYLCLPFKFDSTTVVTATLEHPAFFFMLEGFNSDQVEYFMPLQARNEINGGANYGYMLSEIDFESVTGRPTYLSVKSTRYVEDGEYLSCPTAFAFGVLAEYPWLTAESNEATINADVDSVEVALDSYYDASALTVTTTGNINATVSGRYNKTVLTISRQAGNSEAGEGTVIVSGPAVEVQLDVTAAQSAISEVSATATGAAEAYDLFGRRADATGKGLFIIRHTDGTATKQLRK